MLTQKRTKLARGLGALSVAALAAVSLQIGYNDAFAKGGGGTASPTKLPPPAPTATCTVGPAACSNILPPAGPALPNPIPAPLSSQFNIIGFIQDATVTGGCPVAAGSTAGGIVTVNGVRIVVPTNTILQFPANTLSWADAVCPNQAGVTAIALNGTGGNGVQVTPSAYPSTEINVVGNIVNAGGAANGIGDQHIAALILISQQSVNAGNGYISFIDYNDGSIYVSSGGGAGETRLIINDPNGRYGRAQTTVDVRFAVDDMNPTITADRSGYPMCVPRTKTDPTVAGAPDDPLCPQVNRPKAPNCRNFAAAGIVVRGGDFAATQTNPAGIYCSAFVMKALAGMPGAVNAAAANAANIAGAGDPDPRQQVPFEVGDYITFQGTLVVGGNAKAPVAARVTITPDVMWVHTIAANVGAFTQPKTLPAYVHVESFNLGVNPQPSTAVAIAGLEATPRVNLVANVTDLGSLVDIYLDDRKIGVGLPNAIPSLQNERFRWVTLESMTGTLAEQAAGKLAFLTSAQPFGGGLETQFVGPQAGRARMRAVKVPPIDPTLGACPLTGGSRACAVTQSPTRYVRVAIRELCAPAPGFAAGVPAGNPGNWDGGAFFDINGGRPNLPGAGVPGLGVNPDPNAVPPTAGDGSCLQSAQYANGLFTGQYFAPTFNFIFAEAILGGAPIAPANVWQLDFLVSGENGTTGSSQPGAQVPQPW